MTTTHLVAVHPTSHSRSILHTPSSAASSSARWLDRTELVSTVLSTGIAHWSIPIPLVPIATPVPDHAVPVWPLLRHEPSTKTARRYLLCLRVLHCGVRRRKDLRQIRQVATSSSMESVLQDVQPLQPRKKSGSWQSSQRIELVGSVQGEDCRVEIVKIYGLVGRSRRIPWRDDKHHFGAATLFRGSILFDLPQDLNAEPGIHIQSLRSLCQWNVGDIDLQCGTVV